MSYKRVISLLPSATEMIYALEAQNCLVGKSHECDFPEESAAIPTVSSSSISNSLSSLEIDNLVKEKVWEALSLYELNIDLIKQLQPDLIITQDQCKVCAIHLSDLESLIEKELGYQPKIVSFQPSSLDDFYANFRELGILLEQEEQASNLLEEYSDRIEIIKHKVKFVKHRPQILCIEWMEPLMSAGHWTPELIQIAGGEAVLSKSFNKSEYINIEDIIAAQPDGILIAPCGFTLERTRTELDALLNQEAWQGLKAVQKGHVFIADGNRFFNRSGPGLIDTAEMIAEILQVNQFYYGMEGHYWEQISK
jgi:iron complex transport system substrate-binding protein